MEDVDFPDAGFGPVGVGVDAAAADVVAGVGRAAVEELGSLSLRLRITGVG